MRSDRLSGRGRRRLVDRRERHQRTSPSTIDRGESRSAIAVKTSPAECALHAATRPVHVTNPSPRTPPRRATPAAFAKLKRALETCAARVDRLEREIASSVRRVAAMQLKKRVHERARNSTIDRTRGRIGRPPAGLHGERTSFYPQLSVRIPPTTMAKLRALSRVMGTPISRIVADAVTAYDDREHS